MKRNIPAFFLLQFLFNTILYAQTFQPLGNGLRAAGRISTLDFDTATNRLFAGGYFSQINNVPANNLAWRDSAGWHSFGNGTTGYISAVKFIDGKLFVGGQFTSIYGVAANGIAFWDGVSWHSMGDGINGYIRDIEWYDSLLYVSGYFNSADSIPAGGIAAWNGSVWIIPGPGAIQTEVRIKSLDSKLYAYGEFDVFNGAPSGPVVSFDGTSWASCALNDTDVVVHALTSFQNELVASVERASTDQWELLTYDGATWNLFLDSLQSDEAYPLLASGDTLYYIERDFFGDSMFVRLIDPSGSTIGNYQSVKDREMHPEIMQAKIHQGTVYLSGYFREFDGQIVGGVVALTNGSPTIPFYASVPHFIHNGNSFGYGIYYDSASAKLIAGGYFDYAGDTLALNVASWDGSRWEPMGAGLAIEPDRQGLVRSITKYGGQIYAAGDFYRSGSNSVNNIAVWDGTEWDSVGSGATSPVRDLTVYNNKLFVTGDFSGFNGLSNVRGIVSFDGTTWSATTGAAIGSIDAVCLFNNRLLLSGSFTISGNNARMATYNDTVWQIFPEPSEPVIGLVNIQGTLYSCSDDSVYRFTGTNWVNTDFYPAGGFTSGFKLNEFSDRLMVTDVYFGRTYLENTPSEFFQLFFNTVHRSLPFHSDSAFVTGFLRSATPNVPQVNNIFLFTRQLPSAQFTYNVDTICDHEYVYFHSSFTDYYQECAWSFPGGIPNQSTSFVPVIRYITPGSYDVSFTLTNVFGSDSVYYTSLIHVLDCTVGVPQASAVNLTVYPNPARRYITLKFPDTMHPDKISIHDAIGREFYSSLRPDQLTPSYLTIDCSDMPPGMYLLSIQEGANRLVKKIIKE